MATQAAQTGPKYFTAVYHGDARELRIDLADQKPESAHALLTRVRDNLTQATLIRLESTGKSLQEIVTSIVSGYEAKRGLFQRIWDCILRIFCYTTNLDEITEIANEIQGAAITQDRYLPSFFIQELTQVIGFFRNLPHDEAVLFFDRHRGMKGAPAYCDPQDPSKSRNLEGLHAKDYINLAEALCWYLQVYTLECGINKPGGLERKGDVKESALFEKADAETLTAVERSLSKILLIAARQAHKEGELSRASEYLSRTQRLAGAEDEAFVKTVVDDCLKRGSILHALQAVANLKIENSRELEFGIGRAGLEKTLFTPKDFQALKAIALSISASHKQFVIDFLDACLKQNEILRAYEVFTARGMNAPEERREEIAASCIKAGLYDEAEYLAIEDETDAKSRERIFVQMAVSYLQNNRLAEAEEAACKIARGSVERNELLCSIAKEHVRQDQPVKAAAALAHTAPSSKEDDNTETENLARKIFDIFIKREDYENALKTFVGKGGIYSKMADTLYNRAYMKGRPDIALEVCTQHMDETRMSAALPTLVNEALRDTMSLSRLFLRKKRNISGSRPEYESKKAAER